jgi:hypothetical protein
MKRFFKLLPILFAGLALLTFLLGLSLKGKDLRPLAGFLSQAGTPNEANLEKVRCLPSTLILTGTEILLLSLSGILCREEISVFLLAVAGQLNRKQKITLLLLCGSGALVFPILNFSVVSLASSSKTSGNRVVHVTLPEEYPILRAIQELTPRETSVLIRTRRDLKYVLNYHLYPRRLYFYPDPEVQISQIPDQWMQKHHIEWILEIPDDAPFRFSLQPYVPAKN